MCRPFNNLKLIKVYHVGNRVGKTKSFEKIKNKLFLYIQEFNNKKRFTNSITFSFNFTFFFIFGQNFERNTYFLFQFIDLQQS
jgi:hypothetical protein